MSIQPNKIRLKKQRHRRSCGLACVAMIANMPYNKVVEDFETYTKGNIYWKWSDKEKCWMLEYGTKTFDLHILFGLYGIRSNKRRTAYKGVDSLPEVTILTIDKRREKLGNKTSTDWHWVVSIKRDGVFVVYDPCSGERRLKDVAPIDSYIRVHT